MGPCVSSNSKSEHKEHRVHKVHKVSTMTDNSEQAILQCKIARDKIKTYIKRLEKNEVAKKQKAKEALKNKDRDKARMFLTQAKMYAEQSKSAYGGLNMIEDQLTQIESTRIQGEIYKVLENGNSVLKKLNEEVNIEKWEKMSDDMKDIKAQQDEIGNFFRSKGIEQQDYEEEIDKEMDNLMKLENKEVEVDLPEVRKDSGKKEVVVKKDERVAVPMA